MLPHKRGRMDNDSQSDQGEVGTTTDQMSQREHYSGQGTKRMKVDEREALNKN